MSQRQPSSDSFGIARPTRSDEQQSLEPSKLSRYDFLLAAIPLVLLVSWLAGQLAAVPVWAAMAAGALAALPLVVDGLAINPPA